MQDSPTFPLYTEVMNKGTPKAEEGDGSQAETLQKQVTDIDGSQLEVSQKQLTEEYIKEQDLTTSKEIPSVPQQNLTTEDIQQMNLSNEVYIVDVAN